MRGLLLALALAACGPAKEPAAPAPSGGEPAVVEPSSGSGSSATACEAPAAGEAMTEVQCTCQGGRVNASRGGGDQPACDPNEESIGTVRFGIEGGWCCRPSAVKSPRL